MGFPHLILPTNFIFAPIGVFCLYLSLNGEKRFSILLLKLYVFSLTIYQVGYYWIPYTLFEFGGIAIPFNYFLGPVFCIGIIPQWPGFFIIRHLIVRKINISPSPLIDAIGLTLFEMYFPQQFPTHLGHTWLNLAPYVGLAPLFGVSFFSFITYLFSFYFSQIQDIWKSNKNILLYSSLPLTLSLVACFLFPLKWASDQKLNIRMVQANIGNFVKVDSRKGGETSMSKVLNAYHSLSMMPSKLNLDLIIWPETAFPISLEHGQMLNSKNYIPPIFHQIVSQTDADLFIGGYDHVPDKAPNDLFESEWNATFLFKKKEDSAYLESFYHKIELIPFGETLPFGDLNEEVGQYIQNISYFARGKNFTLFETKKGHLFTAAICYEILFQNFIRKYLNSTDKQAHFIVNLTNDSWYGDSSEPWQHQFLSHWRALEFGRPVVRMTNTGVTSVLYPDGGQSQYLGVYQRDFLDIELNTKKVMEKTFFQKMGNLPLLIIFGFLIIVKFIIFRKKHILV